MVIRSMRIIGLVLGLATVISGSVVSSKAVSAQSSHAQTSANRFDLTGNGLVNEADAALVIDAEVLLERAGICISSATASYDLNADGCINDRDVQLVRQNRSSANPDVTAPDAEANEAPRNVTLTVTSLGDEPDANPGNGQCLSAAGTCTLRAAVQEANRLSGQDTIRFNIAGCPSGTCTIRVSPDPNNLITLEDISGQGTIIDGYTQPLSAANSAPQGSNAQIRIELTPNVGTQAYPAGAFGLRVLGPNNFIRGLAIYNWDVPIAIIGEGADNNRVEGNFIGTNVNTTFGQNPRSGIRGNGVYMSYADDTKIGGPEAAARNVISGNPSDGIVGFINVSRSVIENNLIGLARDGRTQLTNKSDGIDINDNSTDNIIRGNVISGNSNDGIEISHTYTGETARNQILNNYIGVSAFGDATLVGGAPRAVSNAYNGITLEDSITQTTIRGNVIGYNGNNGVRLYHKSVGNTIQDNKIGVAADGITPAPNGATTDPFRVPRGLHGVLIISDGQRNRVVSNLIAYNRGDGVRISNFSVEDYADEYQGVTSGNSVSQNTMLNNTGVGIRLEAGSAGPANGNVATPTITGASRSTVTGISGCANCRVEIFIADKSNINDPSGDNNGEGQIFVGAGTTNSGGSFSVGINDPNVGVLVTATVTDTNGNTSQFARNVQLPAPRPRLSIPLLFR